MDNNLYIRLLLVLNKKETMSLFFVCRWKYMKTVFNYLKEYKKEAILAPSFKMLEAFFDLLVPLVIARLINQGILLRDWSSIWKYILLLLFLALIGMSCSFTAQYFAAKSSVGVSTKLRQHLFDHIQGLSFSQLDKLGTNTLITRITSDINQVQNGINMTLRLLLRSPFIVFGSMIMAFFIEGKMAVIFFFAIILLFMVVAGIMWISIPLFKKVQSQLDLLLGITRDQITGVRVIRAFCKEDDLVSEFDEHNNQYTKYNEIQGKINALMSPLTYIIINVATVVLIYEGAFEVNIGNLNQGEIVALYNYMAQIIVELIKLASLIVTINKSIACASRIEDVLAVNNEMVYKEESRKLEGKTIDLSDVSFRYPDASSMALSDISFSIHKGEVVGITGGTGSGKSTLMQVFARYYERNSGQISLFGSDVKDYSKEQLNQMIGFVSQNVVLFQGSIRENMKWGNEQASDEEIWQALEIAQAKDVVLNKPGQLDFVLEQNGKNLSGGQRQRLTIARALLKKPAILILDDSASALDYATDARLRKAIRQLKDMTVFIVSQRISSIRHADSILVMDDGQLLGKGSHDELLKNCSVYKEIYASQYKEEVGV